MYQNRSSFVKGRNYHRTPGVNARPKYLPIFEVGKLIAVSDLRPEPKHTDYYRRQSWLVTNYVGRVLSSTGTELVLLNLRTGFNTTVIPALGYTLHTLTDEAYAKKLAYENFIKENSINKGM